MTEIGFTDNAPLSSVRSLTGMSLTHDIKLSASKTSSQSAQQYTYLLSICYAVLYFSNVSVKHALLQNIWRYKQ